MKVKSSRKISYRLEIYSGDEEKLSQGLMTMRAATEPPAILETALKTENYALK